MKQTDHSEHPLFEYDQITDQIYLGTNACCATHFKESLLKKGVTADISMEGERQDMAKGVSYFLWLPTQDHTAPSLTALRLGARAMDELIEAGEKVYVHCRNGHGRGPTLVVAYLIMKGNDLETAHQNVKEKRSAIHIEDVQLQRLKEFERSIHT